ncbi:MAG: RluA family pseudouridine synthase [Pseudomonadota bacterium]
MAAPLDPVVLTIPERLAGQRLDRALADLAEEAGLGISRSRIGALLADGAVTGPGADGKNPAKHRVAVGAAYVLTLPPPIDPIPEPQAIPLDVVHEDAHLIVIDKPAGMVVHPAPGAPDGTLVNALLAHCGDSLAGIGGERRPGIVHRIDKDTSGLIVAAKTEAAHSGLSALFATHDIQRAYRAIAWGAPGIERLTGRDGIGMETGGWIRVESQLGRHPQDRKKMAVLSSGGRHALSRFRVAQRFGPEDKPYASLLDCRLETGRTHQIRVHAAHIGHPLIGDPVYARPRQLPNVAGDATERAKIETFPRQALHAAKLGFRHPIKGELLQFCAELPPDMHELLTILRRNM